MLNFLDYYAADLPPTRTYGRRSFVFVPADPALTDGRLGNVTIKMQHAKSGVHRAIELDTYAIEHDPHPEPGDHGGAAYWFTNLTDSEQEQPYRCVVGGLTPHCDCQAGKCKVPGEEGVTEGCKHRDVLLALIDAEQIPGGDDAGRSGLAFPDEPDEMTRAELDRQAEELGWKRRAEMVA